MTPSCKISCSAISVTVARINSIARLVVFWPRNWPTWTTAVVNFDSVGVHQLPVFFISIQIKVSCSKLHLIKRVYYANTRFDHDTFSYTIRFTEVYWSLHWRIHPILIFSFQFLKLQVSTLGHFKIESRIKQDGATLAVLVRPLESLINHVKILSPAYMRWRPNFHAIRIHFHVKPNPETDFQILEILLSL